MNSFNFVDQAAIHRIRFTEPCMPTEKRQENRNTIEQQLAKNQQTIDVLMERNRKLRWALSVYFELEDHCKEVNARSKDNTSSRNSASVAHNET